MSDTTSFLRDTPNGHSEFLIGRAKSGSQRAWDILFERYRTMLMAHALANIPAFAQRRFDAEDIVQKAFTKAWLKIDSFQYLGEGSLRAWLAKIVLRTLRNELRAQHPEERDSETNLQLGEVADPRAGLSTNSAMLEALGLLAHEERDILIQRHFEELSFEDIAEILECSREKARQLHAQAFAKLQRLMKRE